MTHNEKVLAYCKQHGSITVRDAYKLDINSPTKVISNMRKSPNYDVQQMEETRANNSGETKRYMRYYIKEVQT